VRAPIAVYKARFGVLFGSRLCMIEHIGRNSGKRRYVVVEIVDRPTRGRVIVASGFGTRAQWYRNILANPSVRVWIASHPPRIAKAGPLPTEQAAAVLDRYAQDHPRAWAALQPVFETTLDAKIGRDGTTLPLVRIDLGAA
jgi:deazaflavin-dependent oxidoreductase (nitroreductase family)